VLDAVKLTDKASDIDSEHAGDKVGCQETCLVDAHCPVEKMSREPIVNHLPWLESARETIQNHLLNVNKLASRFLCGRDIFSFTMLLTRGKNKERETIFENERRFNFIS